MSSPAAQPNLSINQPSRFLIPLVLLIFTFFIINFTLDMCYNPRRPNMHKYSSDDCMMCNGDFEDFTNEMEGEYSQMKYLYRGQADLTASDSVDNTPSHLMIGKAQKNIVADKNGKQTALISVSGNLYVLDGNVYNDGPSGKSQLYQAFLVNKENGERLLLGNLKREQDGMHHLRVKTTNLEQLVGYNNVIVTYKTNGSEYVILNGKF